jgi:hypothetical protein
MESLTPRTPEQNAQAFLEYVLEVGYPGVSITREQIQEIKDPTKRALVFSGSRIPTEQAINMVGDKAINRFDSTKIDVLSSQKKPNNSLRQTNLYSFK